MGFGQRVWVGLQPDHNADCLLPGCSRTEVLPAFHPCDAYIPDQGFGRIISAFGLGQPERNEIVHIELILFA